MPLKRTENGNRKKRKSIDPKYFSSASSTHTQKKSISKRYANRLPKKVQSPLYLPFVLLNLLLNVLLRHCQTPCTHFAPSKGSERKQHAVHPICQIYQIPTPTLPTPVLHLRGSEHAAGVGAREVQAEASVGDAQGTVGAGAVHEVKPQCRMGSDMGHRPSVLWMFLGASAPSEGDNFPLGLRNVFSLKAKSPTVLLLNLLGARRLNSLG